MIVNAPTCMAIIYGLGESGSHYGDLDMERYSTGHGSMVPSCHQFRIQSPANRQLYQRWTWQIQFIQYVIFLYSRGGMLKYTAGKEYLLVAQVQVLVECRRKIGRRPRSASTCKGDQCGEGSSSPGSCRAVKDKLSGVHPERSGVQRAIRQRRPLRLPYRPGSERLMTNYLLNNTLEGSRARSVVITSC